MPDREDNMTLLRLLAEKVLQAGGSVTSSGMKWWKNNTGQYERENQVAGSEKAVLTWHTADNATADLMLYANRDGHDNVVFHGTDEAGVPWRMLKIDCPYLAIVHSSNDKKALLVLDGRIAHLSALLDKTLYSNEEKFDGRN